MSLYTLIIVTFVIFMAINVIIGLRGRKHASTTKDFLTASGQCPASGLLSHRR